VRFLENHDEQRCASAFPQPRRRAAAAVLATLPGIWLFHAGQEHGHRTRVPVTLAKGGREPLDPAERARWRTLLQLRRLPAMSGTWRMVETAGWPDNASHRDLLAWAWEGGGQRLLCIINWSERRSQAMVNHGWGRTRFSEVRDGCVFERDELYVDLEPWGSHIWQA
jgi:hypothetical protein